MRTKLLLTVVSLLLAAAAATAAAPPTLLVKAKGRWGGQALKFSARYKNGAGAVSFDDGTGVVRTGLVSCQANAGRLVVLSGTIDGPPASYPYFVFILEDHANLGGPDEFVYTRSNTPFDCEFVIDDQGMGNLVDTREPIVRGKIAIRPEN